MEQRLRQWIDEVRRVSLGSNHRDVDAFIDNAVAFAVHIPGDWYVLEMSAEGDDEFIRKKIIKELEVVEHRPQIVSFHDWLTAYQLTFERDPNWGANRNR